MYKDADDWWTDPFTSEPKPTDPLMGVDADGNGLFMPDGASGPMIPLRMSVLNLMLRIEPGPLCAELADALVGAFHEPAEVTEEEKTAALTPFQWFLDRVRGGLTLTSAGYLKPVDVIDLCTVLPESRFAVGKRNREDHTFPVRKFRHMMTECRLVRKYKGQLLLTPTGRACVDDPALLWEVLAWNVLDTKWDLANEANTIHLICDAAGWWPSYDLLTDSLNALGWRVDNNELLVESDVWRLRDVAIAIVENLHDYDEDIHHAQGIPRTEQAFAFAALTATKPPRT